jgi:thiosulfate dehydrogenase [quinone] large subunit
MMRKLGIGLLVTLRLLYGLFYVVSATNKIQRNYMFSDYPLKVFTKQMTVIDPDGLPAAYLGKVIIPNYQLFGWGITLGVIAVATGLLLGLCTRWAALLAIFISINIGLGGFYDASLIVLIALAVLLVIFPAGHHFGLDKRLHRRHPQSIWFR